jgi:hypothetical protein
MITALTKPTPMPAVKRPATRRGTADDATWRITPTRKTPQPEMMDEEYLLPTDKMETMRDFSQVW